MFAWHFVDAFLSTKENTSFVTWNFMEAFLKIGKNTFFVFVFHVSFSLLFSFLLFHLFEKMRFLLFFVLHFTPKSFPPATGAEMILGPVATVPVQLRRWWPREGHRTPKNHAKRGP